MELDEELRFEGCNFFRLRLVYSLLSGRPVVIEEIRSMSEEPGIKDFEAKLLSLFEKITNGTRIEINYTGSEVSFSPGMLRGGSLNFDCGNSRCISYFLEPLLILAPFCKSPLNVKLAGVTNAVDELSVDAIRSTWLPIMKRFVLNNENLDIKVNSRGLKPDGGGSVSLTAPIVKTLRPVQCEKPGKICKIRGVAFVCKVSLSIAHRMIESAKKALHGYLADVYITIDQRKGPSSGNSPGYGLFVSAETTDGVVFHGEAMSKPKGSVDVPAIPEDIGYLAANRLLDEIYSGGCLDSSGQAFASTLMALVDKDVSRFLFGPLTSYSVHCLRHLKQYFGITFKIDDWRYLKDESQKRGSDEKALMTCVGIGYSNFSKTVL